MIRVPPKGPDNADIMIVGEAPGSEEEKRMEPFVGSSGQELTKMLHEAGIARTECFITNVCKTRPPGNEIKKYYSKFTNTTRIPGPELTQGIEELREEIRRVNPKLIIALGDTPLWALTGERGITKWRGSLLEAEGCPVLPTYHPAAILRMWSWRFIAVHDLRRAKRYLDTGFPKPEYMFTIRPSFGTAMEILKNLEVKLNAMPMHLSVDIETRDKHIACIGIGWSKTEAICIPFMCVENVEGYWTLEEETAIVSMLFKVLTHPNIRVSGQNFIYDLQYLARRWGLTTDLWIDTMIAHAVCFPSMPKGLDFLSSMYCEYHKYWKDESKEWDPKLGEEQLWIYNCKDCVVTWEVAETLDRVIDKLELRKQFDMKMDEVHPVLRMMLRGTLIDRKRRDSMMWELQEAMQEREQFFESLDVDGGLQLVKSKNAKRWYRSPVQQVRLFYEFYGVKPIRNRKTGRPTVDDEALPVIAKREPLLAPICDRMVEYRSLGVFLNTFVMAPLDHDFRMRCSYNPVGTETFRFNSSADAFGFGTNLQNIPKGDE